MQYAALSDRVNHWPPHGISDARKASPFAPSVFSATIFNSGPGSITVVSPASFWKNTLRPTATGDDENDPFRRSDHSTFPVGAS